MTLGDRYLTLEDMTIMVHASGIRGYLEVMQDLKFDLEPLLAQHNITLDQLKQDDAWLCQRSVINLFEQTAAIAQCPDLGYVFRIIRTLVFWGF